MKALIVEDLEYKANAIKGVLVKRGISLDEVFFATNVSASRKLLREKRIDLLILDLMLPLVEDGVPKRNSGSDLLEEIIQDDSLNKPVHILCITEHEDLANELDSVVKRSLVHVVRFTQSSNEWEVSLEAKVDYIKERVLKVDHSPDSFGVDLAIITSSPAVELDEVLSCAAYRGEFNHKDALHYHLSDWTCNSGRQLKVVACAAPQMGMTAACITSLKAIERWRPRYLVMAGIAAGVKPEFNFGDVLLGEAFYDYGSGKILDTTESLRVFRPDPRPLTIDVTSKALLQDCERKNSFVADFMPSWKGQKVGWLPKLRLGIIASGAAVVQSPDLVREILDGARKVVGVEMEAYGVVHAANLCSEPRPRVIIAKSVCDYADPNKADDWQQFAAFTSARFIYNFFKQCEHV